jgi:hypothetical protein
MDAGHAGAGAPAHTFIKAMEYWVPNADRSMLEFGGGLYGPASRMARISREMCFGRGEGLPGRAWDLGEPVVLHSFDGSYFKRTAAAQADGLTCGIALPIFSGDYLSSVVVFFCGDGENHAGAIEVWKNDPAESKDMKLADGHYGLTGDTFEFISRRTSFRAGTGLPGLAWLQNAPVFLPDLGKGSGFLRGDSAVKVGINRGLALPCATPGRSHFVLALLSALGTPIARRLEIWRPDFDSDALALTGGFCETQGLLDHTGLRVQRGQGSVGRCWLTGLPGTSTQLAGEPGDAGTLSGISALAVLPVLTEGRFVAAVALYF